MEAPEYPPGESHQCTGIWHLQQFYNRLNIIEVSKGPLAYYYALLNYIKIILFKYEIPPFDVCFLGGLALFSGSSWNRPASGLSAAMQGVQPCEYVFDNQNICPKDAAQP